MPGKQQMYANSCGAAALLTAAVELGVANIPNYGDAFFMGQACALNNPCETAIYKISSGNEAKTGFTPSTAGYSMPHNLAKAAMHLGLTPTVYLESTLYTKAMQAIYPKAQTFCLMTGVTVNLMAPPPLGANERDLVVVGVLKIVGLHYVLKRPLGMTCYMDPADGNDYASFAAMNNSWMKSYGLTGLTIRIS